MDNETIHAEQPQIEEKEVLNGEIIGYDSYRFVNDIIAEIQAASASGHLSKRAEQFAVLALNSIAQQLSPIIQIQE